MLTTSQICEYLWARVEPVPATGCWLWPLQIGANGYPRVSIGGRSYLPAHRISYSAFRLDGGEIPAGMLVCHKCDTPACINPDHLFLGTHSDNLTDSFRKGRRNSGGVATESHCAQGHPWTEENTYWHGNARHCRVCNKIACARYHAKRPSHRLARQVAA